MKFAFMSRILKPEYEGFGMQTLLVGLLQGIAQVNTTHEIFLLTEPDQVVPEPLQQYGFNIVPVGSRTNTVSGRIAWDHWDVGRACKRLQIDALYASAHVRPWYAPCPVVVSVFDMMYHLFPQQWTWSDQAYFRLAVSRLTSRATRIAALSQSTKQDILSILRVPENRVEVVYPGAPEGFCRLQPSVSTYVRERYQAQAPFILFVGSFHPRKNLGAMLDAFESIAERIPHDLVVIGPTIWNNQTLLERMETSSFKERIRFVGLIPRSDLVSFYNEADLFVFPSLYEGFGFPVLEALACGCPTITTNVSSLPEVAGDAALLIEADRMDQLGQLIEHTLADQPLRSKLREAALQQAKQFSWSVAAQKTIELLEQAANKNIRTAQA